MLKIKAFSLIEVLVAMTVFAIGILSVVQIVPMHRKLARNSEKATVATFLAQEIIEEIFSLAYSDIAVGDFEARSPVEPSGDFAQFERRTEVEYTDGDFNQSANDVGLKKITATVYWNEGSQEKSESVITVISQ